VVKNGATDEKNEVRVAKIATVVLGVVAVGFGLLFKEVNVAFMVGLAFAVAASANFPALLLSVFWRKFTTQGAIASMAVGLLSAVLLIALSPTVWTDVFHYASKPPIPLKNPALISMTLSFATAFVVSLLTRDDAAQNGFEEQQRRATFGA